MSFDQDRFNNLCDQFVIARVAEIRYDWLLVEGAASDWETYQKFSADVASFKNELNEVVSQCPNDIDQGDLRDEMEMLEIIAAALFFVNPNIPSNIRQPIQSWNPMVNWFISYLRKTIRFWQGRGRQAALVNAAQEAIELGNE
jgi:hypothetical protein